MREGSDFRKRTIGTRHPDDAHDGERRSTDEGNAGEGTAGHRRPNLIGAGADAAEDIGMRGDVGLGDDSGRQDDAGLRAGAGRRDQAGLRAGADNAPLFPTQDTEQFRSRWTEIQTNFVDEPRRSVEQANDLVAEVTERLTSVFTKNRNDLERQWSAGDEVSTEDLRQTLQRYRTFFERLLSL